MFWRKLCLWKKKDLEDLAEVLKTTQLSNVISTIKMIGDRVKAIDELSCMVYDKNFDANERDNLQTFIEHHYWIFGEQYHLVTAAEPKFEEALRRFVYLLHGKDAKTTIEHPSKNREMDMFAVRCMQSSKEIDNIVVEIKHPNIPLGRKELEQVKDYMSVILEQDQFNGKNMNWEFYLIGNASSKYIDSEMESARPHGEKYLVHKIASERYKIFVLTWSEVITNFEIRHNFLLEKLELERDKLVTDKTSADDVVADLHRNSASMIYKPEPIAPLSQNS